MFRNVMTQLMSSPANTVDSFHCTKARMFDDADIVEERAAAALRWRCYFG